ncbi:MAG: hypothetical protein WDO74_18500 [Pseudomonadota bacterium]
MALASLAPFACGSTPSTTTVVVRPQLVAVDPDDFLGTVRCTPPREGDVEVDASAIDPDAARSYVATLFDVTPASDGGVPDPGTPLASSPPTTCLKPVTFAFVVAGRRYLAEVDAYDQSPEELTPISAGSRLQFNADGTRAVPRWVATCGGYPPSPPVEAGTEAAGAASTADETQPPGVVSYAALTQTPHDCGQGLRAADPE